MVDEGHILVVSADATMTSIQTTASQTLSGLEERLRRVDYVLNGHSDPNAQDTGGSGASVKQQSATTRLGTLERSLQSLVAKSSSAEDVLALQKKQPNLFHPSVSEEEVPSLPPASLASLILAHSNLYQFLAARLPQLQDGSNSIPDSGALAKLIELQPRVKKARERQQQQMKQFANLRTRSARIAEEWYEGGVLGMGERWADWEERLREVEILIRRREAAKRREEGAV